MVVQDPRRIDDGTNPSQDVVDYIATIHPSPIRIPHKSMNEINRIYPESSYYIIQKGELFGLRLKGALHSGKGIPSSEIVPKLKYLYLHNCDLRSLINFPDYPSLKGFVIEDRTITTLKGLPLTFPALWTLGIRCPSLLNLEGFPTSLPFIKKLFLAHSDLRFLKAVKCDAPYLESIDISYCQFRDFSFIHLLGDMFHKSVKIRGTISTHPEKMGQEIMWVIFSNLSALRSFDGLKYKEIQKLVLKGLPSALKNNPIPPFVQEWASRHQEIRDREFPNWQNWDYFTAEEQNNYYRFEDQKSADLIAHAELLAAHYCQNLSQLLDAVLHVNPPTDWPSDFSPELVQRVVHECTLKERHHMLEFLHKEHPLRDFWHPTSAAKIPLPDSKWDIVL
ncbi:MAG: hypothetical protein ACTSYI_05595 [Promethearchaeota archaeon]